MKIALVGAHGYGNIGDDTYPILWRRYFPDQELIFYNSDLPESGIDPETRLIVYGGGGLLWNREGNAHLEYMQFYMDEASRLNIPYGFISCDFQAVINPSNERQYLLDSVFEAWMPILAKARFIQFRSRASVQYLQERGFSASYAPDLAYLFRPDRTTKSPELITSIPAASVNLTNKVMLSELDAALSVHPQARLIVMNMGGPVVDKECEGFSERFPSATLINSNEVTPTRALDIIGRSHIVFTGRYHGMIFARNCGIPYRIYPRLTYKLAMEPQEEERGDPWWNVLRLKKEIAAL